MRPPVDQPTPLGIPTGGRVNIRAGQTGEKTGIIFPIQPVSYIDFERILSLQNKHEGKRFLLVGAGPSSKDWEKLRQPGDIIIACNSAILMLKDVADYFLCTEGNGYELPWFWTKTNAVPIVSYCNLKWPDKDPRTLAYATDAIPIERSWHLAGFNPREYFNAKPMAPEVWNSRDENLYAKHKTFIGVDRFSGREWGLLKGPVCFPGNMSIGTVCVNGAHLIAFLGGAEIASIGFEFHMADGAHACEPKFVYKTSRWAPPECFMKVNGKPTMWHFALSAAFAVSLKPVFQAAGVYWSDYSGGLMDLQGIESLLKHVHGKPRDVNLPQKALPEICADLQAAATSLKDAGESLKDAAGEQAAKIKPEWPDSEKDLDHAFEGVTLVTHFIAALEEVNAEEEPEFAGEEAAGQEVPLEEPAAQPQRKKPGPKPGSHRKPRQPKPAADAAQVTEQPSENH